jgi:hypothetical protein
MQLLAQPLFSLFALRQSCRSRFLPRFKWVGSPPLSLEILEDRIAPAVVTWTGGGNDLNWNNPANWSSNATPGKHDRAVINVSGITITHADGIADVESLTSKAALNFSGGALLVTNGNSEVSGKLTFASGTILLAMGEETTFTAKDAAISDGADLYADEGAMLNIPDLSSYKADSILFSHPTISQQGGPILGTDATSRTYDFSHLTINQQRGTATFTVRLGTKPADDVKLDLSLDPSQKAISPASLTFTPLDWDVPQTVTVTGLNLRPGGLYTIDFTPYVQIDSVLTKAPHLIDYLSFPPLAETTPGDSIMPAESDLLIVEPMAANPEFLFEGNIVIRSSLGSSGGIGNGGGGGGNAVAVTNNGTGGSLGRGQLFGTSIVATGGSLDIVGNLSPLVSPLSAQLLLSSNSTAVASHSRPASGAGVTALDRDKETSSAAASEEVASAGTDDLGLLERPQPPDEEFWDQFDERSDLFRLGKSEAASSSDAPPSPRNEESDVLGPELDTHSVAGTLSALLPKAETNAGGDAHEQVVDFLFAGVGDGTQKLPAGADDGPVPVKGWDRQPGGQLPSSCLEALAAFVTAVSDLCCAGP